MSVNIENISRKYGNQLALDNVSISINKGEIVGFLGPNGAGKSTLMKILTGFIEADQGTAFISGLQVNTENNPLYPEMYIREYLNLVAGFYNINNKKERIEGVVQMTGLTPEIHKKIGSLSKGYRQRVGLAAALVHDPEVLILDEPTTGLDPNQLDEIRKLITSISADKTVILSTHIMQEVEAICNRVLIINKGRIISDTNSEELKRVNDQRGQTVFLELKDPVDAQVLQQQNYIDKIEIVSTNSFIVSSMSRLDIREELFKLAIESNWTILSLTTQTKNIESIFRELTHESKK